jgi:hypothetical protein
MLSPACYWREPTVRITLQLKGRPEKLTVSRAFAHRFHQM